jgi:hypothetical protein
MRLAEFDRTVDRLEYPTTTAELRRRYGGAVLDLQDGSERLDSLLGRVAPEVYASADEVRLAVHGSLPVAAIGRRGYSDRDPPCVGEVEPLSF